MTPTVASHAQDVSHQANAARRGTSKQSVDAKYEEYKPFEASGSRNLVLTIMRSTLVDFLDSFEKLSRR